MILRFAPARESRQRYQHAGKKYSLSSKLANMFQASVAGKLFVCSSPPLLVWVLNPNRKNPGELKASQHLGLARLAAQRFDRLERISLPKGNNILSFRRGRLQNGQQQQQQQQYQQDIGSHNFDGAAGETDNFNKWLCYQRIKMDDGRKVIPRMDGAEEVAATPAAGVVVVYGSYDFRNHAMGYLTRGIFCNHNVSKEAAALRVTCVYGADDTSESILTEYHRIV